MSIENSNDMNQRNSELSNWIKTIGDENTRTYIEIRLIPQMDYYSRASRKFKKKYMCCKTMIIIFGALIPVAALFADYGILAKAVIAALGASVSAITAYIEVQNYHALWSSYRLKREQLLSIMMYYFTDTGIFSGITDSKQKDILLIESCEQYLAEEHWAWREIVDKGENSKEKKELIEQWGNVSNDNMHR